VLDEHELRTLASRPGDPVVTSFYLDVDGRRFPRPSDYAPRVEGLFRQARTKAATRGRRVVDAVEAEIGRIADHLGSGIDRTRTRGIAAFSGPEFFEVFGLPVSVRDQVVLDSFPDVAQLCAILATASPTLVVGADSQRARFLRLDLNEDLELEGRTDLSERWADTDVELGSFERRQEELKRRHLRYVADRVGEELAEFPARSIVLCGPDESLAHLETLFPKAVAAIVVGRINVPMHAGADEMAAAARNIVRESTNEQRAELVHTVTDRAAEGQLAVTGLDDTIEALGDGRVVMLLVEHGLELPGGRCSLCGELVGAKGTCPRCDGTVEELENVVDAAIDDAFAHHVPLEFYESGTLAGIGRIAALLGR
jgi:peptide chain release factor subunit 1